ncbi:MAG: sigma-70 family RNA polymerase sigma factor [Cyanobium sp.]
MTRSIPATRPPLGQALRRRNQLVQAHQQLVRPIAHHYARCSAECGEDLTQVGLLGLIRAAELYRREQGTPFEAFARPHIRGAILHYLRDVAPSVRLPRRQAELLEKLVRHERRGDGRRPTAGVEISEEQRALLLQQRRICRAVPLEGALLESISAEPQEPPIDPAGSKRAVRQLLETLEPRQRRVVSQVVLAGWSYRRLAAELEVSPMTVKRLLHQGLERLRERLDAAGLSPRDWSDPVPSAVPGC